MDEYEKLEKELQRQYEIYLGRFRNIEYLEHELDLYHQVHAQKQRARHICRAEQKGGRRSPLRRHAELKGADPFSGRALVCVCVFNLWLWCVVWGVVLIILWCVV
jgi:hypothetical protein